MARWYFYVLAVWLRLDVSSAAPELLVELREYLEALDFTGDVHPDLPRLLAELREYLEDEYQVEKLEGIEEPEAGTENEVTVSLQLQWSFDESQMDGDEPTGEAIGELDRELRAYLEASYPVKYLDILDDSPNSYLLDEWEEPEQRKYPEPKQRDLTDDEKSQLRVRIERGDADIYALATEFGCSASQVAGIKAAMHR